MSPARCECGAIAETQIYNGMHVLPICRSCYNDDEQIWMEAVMAFADHVRSYELAGMTFTNLHEHFDPNQLIDDLLTAELHHRDMPQRRGEAWLDLVNGAAERYDEWYAK